MSHMRKQRNAYTNLLLSVTKERPIRHSNAMNSYGFAIGPIILCAISNNFTQECYNNISIKFNSSNQIS